MEDLAVRHYLATTDLETAERDHYRVMLEYEKGNVSSVARKLGCYRRTVYLAVKRYGLKGLVKQQRRSR